MIIELNDKLVDGIVVLVHQKTVTRVEEIRLTRSIIITLLLQKEKKA